MISKLENLLIECLLDMYTLKQRQCYFNSWIKATLFCWVVFYSRVLGKMKLTHYCVGALLTHAGSIYKPAFQSYTHTHTHVEQTYKAHDPQSSVPGLVLVSELDGGVVDVLLGSAGFLVLTPPLRLTGWQDAAVDGVGLLETTVSKK